MQKFWSLFYTLMLRGNWEKALILIYWPSEFPITPRMQIVPNMSGIRTPLAFSTPRANSVGTQGSTADDMFPISVTFIFLSLLFVTFFFHESSYCSFVFQRFVFPFLKRLELTFLLWITCKPISKWIFFFRKS